MTLLGQVRQCVQGREGFTGVATRLLQSGQGGVAQHCHKGLKRQRLVDQRHALRQVPFSRIQVVPLAQQVTQAEIVGEAAEHGLQHLRSWDHLHHLCIGGSGLPEPALQNVQLRQQSDAAHGCKQVVRGAYQRIRCCDLVFGGQASHPRSPR